MTYTATEKRFIQRLTKDHHKCMEEINTFSIADLVDRSTWIAAVQKNWMLVDSYNILNGFSDDELTTLLSYPRPFRMISNELSTVFGFSCLATEVGGALSVLCGEEKSEPGRLLAPQEKTVFLNKLEKDHSDDRRGWMLYEKDIVMEQMEAIAMHEGVFFTLKEFADTYAFSEGEKKQVMSDGSIIKKISEQIGLADDMIWEDLIEMKISDILAKIKTSNRGSRGDER